MTPRLLRAASRPARASVLLLVALALPDPSDARQPQAAKPPAKGHYHLFRPTPTESVRELSTDRPDQTESPYTVDAGHFQLELDFVTAAFDRDRGGDLRLAAWSVVPFNAKIGLLDRVDVQVVIDPYAGVRTGLPESGGTNTTRGLGNIATRLKVNFWGNDGGKTAFGVIAFVRWPLPASA